VPSYTRTTREPGSFNAPKRLRVIPFRIARFADLRIHIEIVRWESFRQRNPPILHIADALPSVKARGSLVRFSIKQTSSGPERKWALSAVASSNPALSGNAFVNVFVWRPSSASQVAARMMRPKYRPLVPKNEFAA
jgi:hypothetical protein